MVAEFKKAYIRLVRRAYRYLRQPKLRKIRWLQKIIHPVFDRELWHPCRETAAGGLSIGLFCAMLPPAPFQMILATIGSVKARVNVPLACLACWVSNPLTQIPIIIYQTRVGDFFRDTLHVPVHPSIVKFQFTFPVIKETINLSSYFIGVLVTAVCLALLAYPIIFLLSALIPKLLPKTRYQRAKAKVIARHAESETPPN